MRFVKDYTDFHRNDNDELVYNPKLKHTKKVYEVAQNKSWNAEEKAFLYDTINNGVYDFGRINRAFIAQGFNGLRKVHVDLAKRYIKYGAREAYISGKSLTTAKGV